MRTRFLVVLSTVVACRAPAPVTNVQRNQISATIVGVLTAHLDAMKRFEIDSALTFFAADSTFLYADNGDVIGWHEFAARTRSFPSVFSEVLAINLGSPRVAVLAEDAAVLTVPFEESFRRMTGDTVRMRGQWTVVFQRRSNGWKILQVGAAHVPVTR